MRAGWPESKRRLAIALGLLLLGQSAGCGSKEGGVTASIPGEGATQASDVLHPVVQIKTSLGELTVELDAEKAPISVDNFLGYVERGDYNGTIFHHVEAGFIAVSGGYDERGRELTAEPSIRNEAHQTPKNTRGTLALSRQPDAIDSASNQFFFNLADNASLDYRDRTAEDYGYAVIGHVTKGLDVLDQIGQTPTEAKGTFASLPKKSIIIESMKRLK